MKFFSNINSNLFSKFDNKLMKGFYIMPIVGFLVLFGSRTIVWAEMPLVPVEKEIKSPRSDTIEAWYSIRTNEFKIPKIKAKVIETYWEEHSGEPNRIDESAYLIIDGKKQRDIVRVIEIKMLGIGNKAQDKSNHTIQIRSSIVIKRRSPWPWPFTTKEDSSETRTLDVSTTTISGEEVISTGERHLFKKIGRTKTTTNSTGKTITSFISSDESQ